jgi:hypothetical protein
MSQARFLSKWDIDDFVREGVAYWENMTGTPDIAALKMRSRKLEAQSLLDLNGLGGFSALQWVK